MTELLRQAQAEKLFRTPKEFYDAYAILKRSGYLEMIRPQSTKSLVRITEKGREAARIYATVQRVRTYRSWDGLWRLVIFDIPEEVHGLRDHFRRLLKSLGFQMLQASVWVYPYDVFGELEQLIPDIKKHGWIKLLVATEVIGVGPDYLKKRFGL